MKAIQRSSGLKAFLVAISLVFVSASVLAEPPEGKGKPDKAEKHAGKGKGKNTGAEDGSTSSAGLVMAGVSVALARQYALDARLDMSGYKSLPPGIRKNLARGKPLPPGIAKKVAPSSMLSRLPRHAGYDWQVAGTDLILVQLGTAIIADVLKDVFH
jgi:hypothetical protein